MRRCIPLALALLLIASVGPRARAADDGAYPVAVRWWGQAMISIENWWGYTIVIDPYSADIGYPDPGVEADGVFVTHEHADHANVALVKGEPMRHHGVKQGKVDPFQAEFGPDADEDSRPRVESEDAPPSPNAVRVSAIRSFHDNKEGAERGENAMLLIQTDGVRILHCGGLGQRELSAEQLEQIGAVDVLCIPVGGGDTVDGGQAAGIVEQLNPRIVIPIHYKTEALTVDLDPVDPFLAALSDSYERVQANGNTLAVSGAAGAARDKAQVVLLGYTPWEMPAELAALFDAKEAAFNKSMETFGGLRTDQLDHRPSNGTHTPRWNIEHMLSAELIFFSSVYSKVDPAIAPIQIFPQQMPPDYIPSHPGWDAKAEVRQAQRVRDFTRRFAYLLDGMPLDALPEGAPRFAGDLRGLFKLTEDHWGEHTANVRAKFELEDWPE